MPADLLPPDEVPDAEFPLVLTTGRLLEHWHTGSMTRRAGVLDAIEPVGIAAMNPRDMQKRGLHQGDRITVETRRGVLEAILRADREVAEGSVFMPFCFAESPANRLTNPKLDPFGKIPEFKYCAARVERAPQRRARRRRPRLIVRLIGLAGWSGSGKTTLLAKLLAGPDRARPQRLDAEARAPRLRRRSARQGFAHASARRRARGARLERAALGA